MINTNDPPQAFFERHAAALLARDEKAAAARYAVPSLILFPGRSIVISDARQTEEYFASACGQDDGVDAVENKIVIMGEAPASVWADVTWFHDGQQPERLLPARTGYRRLPDRRAHPDDAGAAVTAP
jgi:hypothetical protein